MPYAFVLFATFVPLRLCGEILGSSPCLAWSLTGGRSSPLSLIFYAVLFSRLIHVDFSSGCFSYHGRRPARPSRGFVLRSGFCRTLERRQVLGHQHPGQPYPAGLRLENTGADAAPQLLPARWRQVFCRPAGLRLRQGAGRNPRAMGRVARPLSVLPLAPGRAGTDHGQPPSVDRS